MKRSTATARRVTRDVKPNVALRLIPPPVPPSSFTRLYERTLGATNSGQRWSESEWQMVQDGRNQGKPLTEIALRLGRTYAGLCSEIKARKRRLSRLDKEETLNRLVLADVVERSHLSLRSLAVRLGIGLTTLHRIASLGQWPTADRLSGYDSITALKDALVAALEAEGLPTANIFEVTQSPRRMKMHNRKLLSYEILARFGLESDPFNLEPNGPEAVFESRGAAHVLKTLKLAVANQNWVALTGDIGDGKTTLLNLFCDRCLQDHNIVVLRPMAAQVGKLTIRSICTYIVNQHSEETPANDHGALYRQVAEILINLTRAGQLVLLVLDEAHRLHAETVASLKNIFEIRDPQAPLSRMIAIVMSGQKKLERMLTAVQDYREVSERVVVIAMPNPQDAIPAYLRHRIRQVGGAPDEIFTEGALKAIAKHARTYQEAANIAAGALERAARKGESGKLDQAWVEEECVSMFTREAEAAREMGKTAVTDLKVAE